MAYTKTTWNNLSNPPINADNLNKIEQGIYDNSLGIDKINPSGPATTPAEIEEGQINDVIGFKSLKLKGQTSQYTTTGKNKLSLTIENKTAGGITLTKNNDNSYKISGTSTSLLLFNSSNTQTLTANTTYTLGLTNGNNDVQLSLRTSDGNTQYAKTEGTATYVTFTPTTDIEVKLYVRIPSGVTVNETIFPIVVEGSTIGTYEPYTGEKASPNPDFPQDVNNVSGDNVVRISNKNLYDKDDSSLIMNNVYINATGFVLTSSNNMKTICMPCRANTTYTVSKTLSSRFIIGTASSNTIGTSMTAGRTNPFGTQVSVTSGANDKYLFVFYYHGTADTKTEQEIRNSIQVEIGTSATSYIAHQGNNFEINLGKNILDYATNVIENALINTTGLIATTSECTTVWCKVKPNTTYTLSREKGDRIVIGGSNTQPALNLTTTLLKNEGVTEVKNYTFNSGNYKYVAIYISRYTTTKPTWVQVEKGTIATSYADYFPPIEICKIGTYQDYIFKKDGKWWKHKEIGKIVIDETYNWTRETSSSWVCPRFYCATLPDLGTTVNGTVFNNSISNMAKVGNTSDYTQNENVFLLRRVSNTNRIDCIFDLESVDDLKSILANENMLVYYGLITPTEEEITYTPLIRQLDELYNSGLYDVTNISQDNSSEAFILDMEACKNNINGIIEYIRR